MSMARKQKSRTTSFTRQPGYRFRPVTFRPCLSTSLALSCFLILLPELYVKRLFKVNGTAWYSRGTSKLIGPKNGADMEL